MARTITIQNKGISYEIVRELGSGVTAVAYLAENPDGTDPTEQRVVLKQARPNLRSLGDEYQRAFNSEWDVLNDFQRYFKANGQPTHYTPKPLDYDPDALIVQSLAKGRPIASWLDYRPTEGLPERDCVAIIRQVSEVLQVLHDQLRKSYLDFQLKNIFWEAETRQVTVINWNHLEGREGETYSYRDDLVKLGQFFYRMLINMVATDQDTLIGLRLKADHRWEGITAWARQILYKALRAKAEGGYEGAAEMRAELAELERYWQLDDSGLAQALLKLQDADWDGEQKQWQDKETGHKVGLIFDLLAKREALAEETEAYPMARSVQKQFVVDEAQRSMAELAYQAGEYSEAERYWQALGEQSGELAVWRWLQLARAARELGRDYTEVRADLEAGVEALAEGELAEAGERLRVGAALEAVEGLLAEVTLREVVRKADQTSEDEPEQRVMYYEQALENSTAIPYRADLDYQEPYLSRSSLAAEKAKWEQQVKERAAIEAIRKNLATGSDELTKRLETELRDYRDSWSQEEVVKYAADQAREQLGKQPPNLRKARAILESVLGQAMPVVISEDVKALWLDILDLQALQGRINKQDYPSAEEVLARLQSREGGNPDDRVVVLHHFLEQLISSPSLVSVAFNNLVRAMGAFVGHSEEEIEERLEAVKARRKKENEEIRVRIDRSREAAQAERELIEAMSARWQAEATEAIAKNDVTAIERLIKVIERDAADNPQLTSIVNQLQQQLPLAKQQAEFEQQLADLQSRYKLAMQFKDNNPLAVKKQLQELQTKVKQLRPSSGGDDRVDVLTRNIQQSLEDIKQLDGGSWWSSGLPRPVWIGAIISIACLFFAGGLGVSSYMGAGEEPTEIADQPTLTATPGAVEATITAGEAQTSTAIATQATATFVAQRSGTATAQATATAQVAAQQTGTAVAHTATATFEAQQTSTAEALNSQFTLDGLPPSPYFDIPAPLSGQSRVGLTGITATVLVDDQPLSGAGEWTINNGTWQWQLTPQGTPLLTGAHELALRFEHDDLPDGQWVIPEEPVSFTVQSGVTGTTWSYTNKEQIVEPRLYSAPDWSGGEIITEGVFIEIIGKTRDITNLPWAYVRLTDSRETGWMYGWNVQTNDGPFFSQNYNNIAVPEREADGTLKGASHATNEFSSQTPTPEPTATPEAAPTPGPALEVSLSPLKEFYFGVPPLLTGTLTSYQEGITGAVLVGGEPVDGELTIQPDGNWQWQFPQVKRLEVGTHQLLMVFKTISEQFVIIGPDNLIVVANLLVTTKKGTAPNPGAVEEPPQLYNQPANLEGQQQRQLDAGSQIYLYGRWRSSEGHTWGQVAIVGQETRGWLRGEHIELSAVRDGQPRPTLAERYDSLTEIPEREVAEITGP